MGQIVFLNRSKSFPFKSWVPEITEKLTLFTQHDIPEEDGYDFVFKKESLDQDALMEWQLMELSERHPVKAVVCHSEYDLLRAAKLREYFRLPGQNTESALAYRNKVIMKDWARKADIEVAHYREITTPADIAAFIRQYGYPVVIKPIDGGGSRHTSVLRDSEECRSFLEKGMPPGMMIESFVEGEMYHVDGLMHRGEMLFSSVSRYVNGCLSFYSGTSLGSVILNSDPSLVKRLQREAERTLHALPAAPVVAFHAEYFLTKDNRILLCEIASRTGGARVVDANEAAFGFHLNREWIRLQCGLDAESENVRENAGRTAGWLIVPPGQGILRSIPANTPFEWVVSYVPALREGEQMTGAASSVDHMASFVVEGADEREVEARIMELDRWFRDQIRIEA
ncbi:acetyl-CoA carboxylase biotin carboxylase subunit family protein [Paenibacillus lentus]|uniref:ATP-grasp domain-containing protein n=1 Tax=Paenibacillus lentus TaxID=1338368 RepID=UPI00365682D2